MSHDTHRLHNYLNADHVTLEAMAQLLFDGMVTCYLKRKFNHTDEEVEHVTTGIVYNSTSKER